MKHLFLLICALICLAYKGLAQQSVEQLLKGKANGSFEPSITAKGAAKLIGTEVYICDSVFNYKNVNDTLKILFMGNRKRNKALLIIIKGRNTVLNPGSWVGARMCVTGTVISYGDKPAIVVTSDRQLGVRIQI